MPMLVLLYFLFCYENLSKNMLALQGANPVFGAKADAKVRTSYRTAKHFPEKITPKTEKNAPIPHFAPFLKHESGRKRHFR